MSTEHLAPTYADVALDAIDPSSTNPRRHFAQAYLDELAGSVKEKGVLQPILLRPKAKNRFEIVAGECRTRAAKLAGLTHIPAILRSLNDEQVLEIQLIENIHRRDLTPLEEARGYRALIDANPTKHSAESIASRIGMSVAYVWDRLKLNDLIPEAKKLLETERIAIGHAILISRLTADQQKTLINPQPINDYQGRGREGLWRTDSTFNFDDEDVEKGEKRDKYFGLQPVSIRELQEWIDKHIRFDVAHAAKAQPFEFEALAAKVEEAVAKPGRGRKVIAITYSHFTQPDARSDEERTYGPQSWRLADSSKGNPTCDHSLLGLVVAGEGRGESHEVCIARDKCDVHWKKEKAARAKNQKLRESGKGQQASRREDVAEQKRQAAERAKEERWKAFSAELKKRTLAAAEALTVALSKRQYAAAMNAIDLPANVKIAHLPRAILRQVIENDFQNTHWSGREAELVKWARLLDVDVEACEPTAADGAAKKPAKKGKG